MKNDWRKVEFNGSEFEASNTWIYSSSIRVANWNQKSSLDNSDTSGHGPGHANKVGQFSAT